MKEGFYSSFGLGSIGIVIFSPQSLIQHLNAPGLVPSLAPFPAACRCSFPGVGQDHPPVLGLPGRDELWVPALSPLALPAWCHISLSLLLLFLAGAGGSGGTINSRAALGQELWLCPARGAHPHPLPAVRGCHLPRATCHGHRALVRTRGQCQWQPKVGRAGSHCGHSKPAINDD